MKPSRTQLLLLIACLFVIAAPVLAQTSSPPVTLAAAGGSNTPLPDAPSSQRRSASAPPSARGPLANGEFKTDRQFMMVNGLMFGSSIANVELTTRCFNSGACSALPGPLRSRGALYGIGLTTDVGVTVLGHYLKRSGYRWWFVPAAAVTVGNVVYGIHAARYIH